MATSLTTFAKLVAIDNFSGPMRGMVANAQKAHAKFAAMSKQASRALGGGRRGGGLLGGAVVSGWSASLVGELYETDAAFNKLQATLRIKDKNVLDPLRKHIMKLAEKYPATAAALAKSANEMAQANMSQKDIIATLESTIQGSMANNMTPAKVAEAYTDIIMGTGTAFATAEEKKKSFFRVNDIISRASTMFSVSPEQLIDSLRRGGPVASLFNIQLEEMAVHLGLINEGGFKASRAGKAYSSSLLRMAAPTKAMRENMRNFGIEYDKYAKKTKEFQGASASGLVSNLEQELNLDEGSFDGTRDQVVAKIKALQDDPKLRTNTVELGRRVRELISKGLGGAASDPQNGKLIAQQVQGWLQAGRTQVDAKGLFQEIVDLGLAENPRFMEKMYGKNHAPKMIALGKRMRRDLDTGMSDNDRKIKELYGTKDGSTAERARIQQQNMVGSLDRLKSAYNTFLIRLGDTGVAGTLANVFDDLNKAIKQLEKSNPTLLKWGTLATLAAGAAVPLGFALSGLAGVLRPFGLLAGGLFAVTKGLTALAISSLALKGASAGIIAMRFGLVGLVAVGVGAGLTALMANLKELSQWGKGFGTGFMRGWADKLGVDANGAITSVDGLATKIKSFFSTLMGVDENADPDKLRAWFDSGASSGQSFADALGKIVENLEAIVKAFHEISGFVFGSDEYKDIASDRIKEVNKRLTDQKKYQGSLNVSHEAMKERARIKRLGLDEYKRRHGAPRFQGMNDNEPLKKVVGGNVRQITPADRKVTPLGAPPQKVEVEQKLKQEFHHTFTGIPDGVSVNTTTKTSGNASATPPAVSSAGRM